MIVLAVVLVVLLVVLMILRVVLEHVEVVASGSFLMLLGGFRVYTQSGRFSGRLFERFGGKEPIAQSVIQP